ncbi:MAG: hypothetical protein QXO32_07475 [Candidatus Bathyarchaeia archaeon]
MGKWAFRGIAAVMAASSFLYLILAVARPSLLDTYTDYSVAALAFLPVVTGFYLVDRYGSRSIFGKCFAYLTSGATLWFLGELLWPVYTRILNVETPFPSLSDLFWMSGYVFMGLGTYTILKRFNPTYALKRRTILSISLLTAALSVITFTLASKIYKAPLIDLIIYNYYLIADIVILGLLTMIYSIFRGGKISKAWLILVTGITTTFLADIFFNLATSTDSETYLLFSDLIYMNGYSLIALGFTTHAIEF